MTNQLTVNEAKKDAIEQLKAAGIIYTRIQAKTVSFQDLARDGKIFVLVDAKGSPAFGRVQGWARSRGYILTTF